MARRFSKREAMPPTLWSGDQISFTLYSSGRPVGEPGRGEGELEAGDWGQTEMMPLLQRLINRLQNLMIILCQPFMQALRVLDIRLQISDRMFPSPQALNKQLSDFSSFFRDRFAAGCGRYGIGTVGGIADFRHCDCCV